MSRPVHVIGLDAGGPECLPPRARDALRAATLVAGGRRHLALAVPDGVETFVIGNNVDALIERLEARRPDERCVVLASGDPLLYGIGATLLRRLGPEQLLIEPAASSLQLAFARVPCSWHDAAIGSVHGRPLAATLLPLLGRPRIGLLTQDGAGPSAVAEYFVARGLPDYEAWVCEELGTPEERVTHAPIAELAGRRFADLNVVVLVRSCAPLKRVAVPPDAEFAAPATGAVLLTHEDVRSITLERFRDLPEGPLWDIGAGLGGTAVGLANRFPATDVVAVERSAAQVEFLRENRRRFEAWNLRIVHAEAPAALADEPAPAAVFVGGSGGHLDGILDLVLDRMRPSGVLVANFVGLENLSRSLEIVRGASWPVDVTQVSVAHGRDLSGLTTFVPQRPVWVVRATRPDPGGPS